MDVSIVIPICNEYENLPLLYEQLSRVLDEMGRSAEVILVDDGSTDGSTDRMRSLASRDDRVKVVRFRRNYGQTAALQAGIQFATGQAIVTMDGDLQNDARDIGLLLDKLDEGYDLVHGWRKDRHDAWLNRRLPSQIANWLISRVTRFPIHDLGCTLKALRRDVACELELYGEMHRFIPILAHARGARCLEIVTRHHARRHGTTKYGISRTFRVILDLITVKYILSYFASPMKLFGAVGLGCAALASVSLVGTVAMKLLRGVDMTGNPLLLLATFCMLAAIQFLSLGLLGEVNARIYYGSADRKHYAVRELINFAAADESPIISCTRRAA